MLSAKAERDGKPVFLCELEYAGLFCLFWYFRRAATAYDLDRMSAPVVPDLPARLWLT